MSDATPALPPQSPREEAVLVLMPVAAPPPAIPRGGSRRLGFVGFAVAIIGLALVINGTLNPTAIDDTHDLATLGAFLLIVVFVGSAFLGRRLRTGEIVRGTIGWAVVGIIVIGAYGYRAEIASVGGRVLSAFAPGVPLAGRLVGEPDATSVVVMRAPDGQFAVRAHVEDVPLTMLIDTGASFVTLTLADAAGVGIDIRNLAYTVPIRTANGLIHAAPVTIHKLVVGTIERGELPGLVAPADSLNESLLGMSFLETLGSYAISGDRLVLDN